MSCEACGKPKCTCGKDGCSSGAAVVIKNATEYVNFRKVIIPASMGDETTVPPLPGKYCNALVEYEATGAVFVYSSDKMPTRIDGHADTAKLWEAIHDEEDERKAADKDIWTEIETIEASSDVVDVVGTYAELQQYDTSKLHANDLIKVLADETHDDAITYYRWDGTAFTYVGAEGPYYTASETDTLLSGKQNVLTAGSNITISDNTISATDTTYTHFTGATASADGTQGLVPAPVAGDENKVLKGDGTWGTAQGAANTIFYMNASESGSTRHIYKSPDMTGLASSKDVFDANELGQVILRISTSVTPDQYSDCYLQNAYKATGDYQLLFLDERTYRSFDTTNINDTTFSYSVRVLQSALTAGTNVQIIGTTISATDTTYSAFTGATSSVAGVAGLVPAPTTSDPDKFLKGDGTWATVSAGSSIVQVFQKIVGYTFEGLYYDQAGTEWVGAENLYDLVKTSTVLVRTGTAEDVYMITRASEGAGSDYDFFASNGYGCMVFNLRDDDLNPGTYSDAARYEITMQERLTAGSNITISNQNVISATDTTYSDFGGATQSVAGSAGLVPAPTTSDPDKFLKGDGTWSTLPAANNISSTDWNGLWQ